MHETEQLIDELDRALAVAPPLSKASMLRQVTELFVVNAPAYGPEHVAVYDAVMKRLTGAVDPPVLAEVSMRLAPIDNAPAATVGVLSRHDDIVVARPILERSNAIAASDVVDVAKGKSQDWPAPGSEDTELGVFMGPEVRHGEAEVHTRVQA